MESQKLYTLVFTHSIGYPHFDQLLYKEIPYKGLSPKGHLKTYLFKLANVIQSEATLKLILIAISLNIIYERCLNF